MGTFSLEKQPPKKFGVLGGTFDPVHLGHLGLARFVRRTLGLDQVLFIPAPRPPHKVSGVLTPYADRYEMLRLALADTPGFLLSDLEAERRGPSFSVDTLIELRKRHGSGTRFYFLIGMDAFLEFHTWKDYRLIPSLADLVVINRADYSKAALSGIVRQMGNYRWQAAESCWSADGGERIFLLEMEPVIISSTMVREAAAAGRSLENLVPAAVAGYIRQHHLYRY